MKLILLSGGSGKRLWPLSNDLRSKQFLKVLHNDKGQLESMVQRVWRQIDSAGLAKDAYIATGKSQADMIYSQIGNEVPIIIESERRDTFPAIALSATYLYSIAGVGLHEIVAVLPVDPYVGEGFFRKVKDLELELQESGAELALIGVKPTFPSEKYGYIVPKLDEATAGNRNYMTVSHFIEKPPKNKAKELIELKALWNCGVFAFRLDYMINLLIEKGLPIQYEAMAQQYGSLPKISFDYEVVEKTKHIVAVPYDGYWKDLGTWNTLTEEMATSIIGRGVMSEDCCGTHIINELDIPVAALGISNVVVAASPDGILVSEKSASPRLKELVKFDQRPMYEEHHWGWYRVLDFNKYEHGDEVMTKRIFLKAGKNLSYQMHHQRQEVWTIVSGEGEVVLNHGIVKTFAGDVLRIPAKTLHGIKAVTDLEFIEVQIGRDLIDEDIVEIYADWTEVEHHCNKAR